MVIRSYEPALTMIEAITPCTEPTHSLEKEPKADKRGSCQVNGHDGKLSSRSVAPFIHSVGVRGSPLGMKLKQLDKSFKVRTT